MSDAQKVTLVIEYRSGQTVRLEMSRQNANDALRLRSESGFSIALTRGRDAADNSYSLDVGTAAMAVYVQAT